MRICLVNASFGPTLPDTDALLAEYSVLRALPPALAALGHSVTVVQAFHSTSTLVRAGATYRFVAPPQPVLRAGRILGRACGTPGLEPWLPVGRLLQVVADVEAEVVHFFGAVPPRRLSSVGRLCRRLGVPLTSSVHGGRVPRSRAGRWRQRRGLSRPRHVLFTSEELALPFVESDLVTRRQVVPCMEGSSDFRWESRRTARERTGMTGAPVFLWAGNLTRLKDPVTALEGFAMIGEVWPDARLYMAYREAELEGEVAARVESQPVLRDRVQLLGHRSFAEMQDLFNSADFFLQASHLEFSGFAVLDAMACGTIPIVTDIPSFRVMTDGGRHGRLFPIRDPAGLSRAVREVGLDGIPELSRSVLEQFEAHLSYRAIAQRYASVFENLALDVPGSQLPGPGETTGRAC